MSKHPRSYPFRLFDLDEVPLKKMVSNLDYKTLVHLSLSTKTAPPMRSLITKEFTELTRIEVKIERTWQSVSVVGPSRKSFTLRILNPRHECAADMLDTVTYNIGGVDMVVCHKEDILNMVKKDFERDLVRWVDYLKGLFECKMGTISLRAKWDTDFDVIMKDPLFFKSDELIICPFAVHSAEMEFFFEKYETARFDCRAIARNGFKYEKPIIFPSVIFHYGWFLTLQNLIQMSNDCKHIEIIRCKLKGAELNEWLKHWMASTTTKVESLSITVPFSPQNEPIATSLDILADIPTLSMVQQRPFANMEAFERINESPSWDLKRDDEVWATVFIEETQRATQIEFHLWTTTVMELPRDNRSPTF